ncbi:MAG: MaoC family dehydratase N-terminal domain-containing protein [Spirochaetales bacterium]|nr:MaoC family dehydratase N-terminal domain-containing protein [Leptospiraceae bacterium]MCP5483842.1 MaoC family dehydratase N-terminal domain-containing protein [Spirochaetales bacterium]MCP5486865.1 MaoC family dehydratase N-terminal domain-containing protein [Spirochaetales bacterium]
MPELSKDIVGTKLDRYQYAVERGKVQEFCKAIGETNPIYTDVEAAKKEGFKDTPIPPTFQTAFMFWGYPKIWEDMRSLGVDTDRLLHMKEEYNYLKPLYPGTTITAQAEVSDVKIGKMNMVTFRSVYSDESGAPCIEAEMAIVIRPPE